MPLPRYFEKLAKKHWAHFYQPDLFWDTNQRKAHFRPFKKEAPNRTIADLYANYLVTKDQKIKEYEEKWNDVISQYLTTDKAPDFITSNTNALYDLRNKQKQERF